MIKRATNPAEAADMVKQYPTPLQIIIPKRAKIVYFVANMRAYLAKYKMIALVSNASTRKDQIIYISEKWSNK